EVGATLPEALRETGIGGIAGTETGRKIRKKFFALGNDATKEDK
ncbi:MAG: L-serine ammonia-lyase, iron-sulfur-dependent, subunit alpha, partial [Anaerococcus hydrogenalis]|nr:L-serine ammonia-lyase, iron-sulfur-dependent, subunit alpha [Anaerococcus hydrogenalis]